MTKKDSLRVVTPKPAPSAKTNASRKRRGVKRELFTSRYSSKVVNQSFRFHTSHARVRTTKQTKSENRENTDESTPKVVADEEDETIPYSMLTEHAKRSPIMLADSTSDYFLHTSSSAYGSVLSLGPLVYTWISSRNYDDIRSNCTRPSSPSANIRDACDSCLKILHDEALRHFEACPIFRRELEASISNENSTVVCPTVIRNKRKSTCVERVGQWVEAHSLRHLCPNQCYLRAFAPSREWMLLRTKLNKITPIGEVLNDWTCRLVYETEQSEISESSTATIVNQNAAAKDSKSVKLSPVHLPRTVFVSMKSSKSFTSFEKIRKSIFDESDPFHIMSTGISTPKKSGDFVIDKKNRIAAAEKVASPFGLLEELFTEEPWRVLICTMLLNKTQRKQNLDGILFQLFERWPTAESVAKDADDDEESVRDFVFGLVRPTGLGHAKAKAFVRLSRDYILLLKEKIEQFDSLQQDETMIIHDRNRDTLKGVEFQLTRKEVQKLFNCGDYAADAYQIFIQKDFRSAVLSNDHMLVAYAEWKRSLSRL